MKKFLTVLLVIAVMFTFSFGTAMAGVNYTYDQAVAELQKVASNEISDATDAMTVVIADESKYTGYSKDAAKVVAQSELDDITSAVKKELDNQLTALYEESKTNTTGEYDIAARVSAIQGIFTSFPTLKGLDLSKEELKLVKADVSKKIEAIDLSVYSTEVKKGDTRSNYSRASELVTRALTLIESKKVSDDKDTNDGHIADIKSLYAPAVGVGDPSGLLYTNAGESATVDGIHFVVDGYNGLKKIPTTANTTVEANKLAYAKTKTLSEVLGAIAADKEKYVDYYQGLIFAENQKTKVDADKVDALQEKLDAVKAAYDDAVEVVTYLVNAAEDVESLGSFTGAANTTWAGTNWVYESKLPSGYETAGGKTLFQYSYIKVPAAYTDVTPKNFGVSDCSTRVDLVKEAKENAELLKATIAIDNSTLVEIDAALEDAIDAIYKGTKTTATIAGTNAYDYLYHYVEGDLIGTATDTVKVNDVKYDNIATWEAKAKDGTTYDSAKVDDVKAIVKEAKAAVRAAATVEEANAAFLAAYEKYDAVITAAEHQKDFRTPVGANYKKFNDVQEELTAYAAAKIKYLQQLGSTTKDYATLGTGLEFKALKEKYNGVTGEFYTKCFTAEELDTKLAEAKAVVDGLKTEKVLGDEAAAIEKEVAALPTAPTLADKDAIIAVFDKVVDHNDYVALVDSGKTVSYAKINSLVDIVKKAEEKAIEDAIAAIKKTDNKATLDEKKAVEDLRASYDAYKKFWTEKDYTGKAPKTYNDVEKFEAQIEAAEVLAVKNMIAKLPADGSDIAAVKAAREAFNALSRDGQHQLRCADAYYYDKLVDAEKMVARSVETLKIKASSSAKKGSITVKWTVNGNAAAADGYQLYKSTKAQKGYKKCITTTKTSFKNTKNLKKGTRYYYKVRAYAVVDGVKVYSDWSNKANRIAK